MLVTTAFLISLVTAGSVAQHIVLPGSPGHYNVTIRTSELVDLHREDPLAPADDPHQRRIMISVFSPIVGRDIPECRSPYMPAFVAAFESHTWATNPPPLNISLELSRYFLRACSQDVTYGLPDNETEHPSSDPSPSTFPLIFFSPGSGGSRFYYNVIAQFLASYGYIVVTIDHPYDTSVVLFPDESVIYSTLTDDAGGNNITLLLDVRTADVSFVLDQMSANTTLTNLVLPSDVAIRSPGEAGIWGHSFGGDTAANALLSDKRFKGGMNMDGTIYGQAPELGFDQPFILWQHDYDGLANATDPTFIELWPRLHGFKRFLQVSGSQHYSYSDGKLLVDLVGEAAALIGTIDGLLMVDILASYARDFFAFVLEGEKPGLLQGPSDEYPDVTFIAGV